VSELGRDDILHLAAKQSGLHGWGAILDSLERVDHNLARDVANGMFSRPELRRAMRVAELDPLVEFLNTTSVIDADTAKRLAGDIDASRVAELIQRHGTYLIAERVGTLAAVCPKLVRKIRDAVLRVALPPDTPGGSVDLGVAAAVLASLHEHDDDLVAYYVAGISLPKLGSLLRRAQSTAGTSPLWGVGEFMGLPVSMWLTRRGIWASEQVFARLRKSSQAARW
jgi:hypothetical protein